MPKWRNLVDALDSGSSGRKPVGVRLPPSAPALSRHPQSLLARFVGHGFSAPSLRRGGRGRCVLHRAFKAGRTVSSRGEPGCPAPLPGGSFIVHDRSTVARAHLAGGPTSSRPGSLFLSTPLRVVLVGAHSAAWAAWGVYAPPGGAAVGFLRRGRSRPLLPLSPSQGRGCERRPHLTSCPLQRWFRPIQGPLGRGLVL